MSEFTKESPALSQESELSLSSEPHESLPEMSDLTEKSHHSKPTTSKKPTSANSQKTSNSSQSCTTSAPVSSTSLNSTTKKKTSVKIPKNVKAPQVKPQPESMDCSSDSSFSLSDDDEFSESDTDESSGTDSTCSSSSSSEDESDKPYSSKRAKINPSDDRFTRKSQPRTKNRPKKSPEAHSSSKKRKLKTEEEIIYKLSTHPQTKFKELGFEMKALGFSSCNSFLKRSKEIKDREYFANWVRDYSPYHADTLASSNMMFKNSSVWSLFLHHLCAFAIQWNVDNVEHTSANFLRNWSNKSYDL